MNGTSRHVTLRGVIRLLLNDLTLYTRWIGGATERAVTARGKSNGYRCRPNYYYYDEAKAGGRARPSRAFLCGDRLVSRGSSEMLIYVRVDVFCSV